MIADVVSEDTNKYPVLIKDRTLARVKATHEGFCSWSGFAMHHDYINNRHGYCMVSIEKKDVPAGTHDSCFGIASTHVRQGTPLSAHE